MISFRVFSLGLINQIIVELAYWVRILFNTMILFYYYHQNDSLCICNSVETAQPGDRTTNPCIVMPECYASCQRVDSLARVVITPVRHTHTRLPIHKAILKLPHAVPLAFSTQICDNFSPCQKTRDVGPVLAQCWPTVCDGSPTLNQHCTSLMVIRIKTPWNQFADKLTQQCSVP